MSQYVLRCPHRLAGLGHCPLTAEIAGSNPAGGELITYSEGVWESSKKVKKCLQLLLESLHCLTKSLRGWSSFSLNIYFYLLYCVWISQLHLSQQLRDQQPRDQQLVLPGRHQTDQPINHKQRNNEEHSKTMKSEHTKF